MPKYFDADMGTIWVQPGGPGEECKPLICHSTGGPTEPLGDVTTRLYRDANGWHIAQNSQGQPNRTTMTIEAYLAETRTWIQDHIEDQTQRGQSQCELPIYIHMAQCGRQDTFLNYDYGKLIKGGIFNQRAFTNMVRMMAEAGAPPADMTGQAFDLSGEPYAPEYWKIRTQAVRTIAETKTLYDIAMDDGRCLSACGPARSQCQYGVIVSEADTPSSQPNTWYTDDGWVTGTSYDDPFHYTGISVVSVVRFEVDRNVTRTLVAQGTHHASGFHVAYRDTGDADWTVVQVSASTTENAVHSGALFALDQFHIWLVSDLGNVYFSNDGAATWTDQSAPDPGTGAEPLLYVSFPPGDPNNGWAVGGDGVTGNHILKTTDGATWEIVTGPAARAGDVVTAVAAIDSQRAWIIYENGYIYRTVDAGENWENMTGYLGQMPTGLGDIMALDAYQMVAVGYRTVSGSS